VDEQTLNAAIAANVEAALAEDLGRGDLSADLIPADTVARARVLCRDPAVICGGPWFDEVFWRLDPDMEILWQVRDGEGAAPGQTLCLLQGRARALVSGERTALNFLQTLSGTATVARRFADAVAGTRARILDTRKTLPGLRVAQKYAVRTGGCQNHRLGLYDGILVKENHIRAAGGIGPAITAIRVAHPGMPVEIEVESLGELRQALAAGAERILLDNFGLEQMREAVGMTAGRAELEVSGGVDLETLRAIAETGVDYISVGALTKHLRAVDLSMLIED